MANTYSLISSNVLSSSAASVTFSAIPATYTDLVLRCSVRTDNASGIDNLGLVFNSDTSSLYSSIMVRSNGTTASSASQTNAAYIDARQIDGNTATSNTFGSTEIYIPNYTVAQNKTSSVHFVSENNLTAGYNGTVAGLYRSTTAISAITLNSVNSNNFLSGSSFYLYGISNA